ncbi:MAG: hypothetical protein ABJP87_04370 [Bauldia litoralis]|uniref:hypothetical protein n=1 Tax=Bauldia litoralis TaxID=665467 RepID=UPI00329A38EF
MRKTDNLNQQVDNLDFRIRKYGSLTFVPELGDTVVVTRGATTIFGGVIVRVRESLKSAKILEYTVTCNDYSQFLKRELVTERYENKTVSYIISDLISNYTTDSFTTTNVAGALTIESISFNRLNVADCLQKLADAISYVWYVDYAKDVHFFPKNTETGEALTDTSGNYIYDTLEIMEDLTQVRNVVLVQGGERVSDSARTELHSGDGTRTQFALANKFDSKPTIEVDSVAQTVGVEFLDDDASFDVMWNFNEKYIRFTSGNTPASGTNNIDVSGTYLYPIVVSVPNNPSIAEFGRYEFAITDKSIRSQDEAIRRAIAELQSYQSQLYEGQFRTYNNSFRSGQVITITSTQRQKSISVLIQSVAATMRDPEGTQLEYVVRFATLKSIGIIDYLQNQLRSKEVIVDDQETLLNFIADDTDTIATSDTLDPPTDSSPPYVWAGAGGNEAVWGYFTWS